MKRHGRVIKDQATTTEQLQTCVSQQYRKHMLIDAEWEDLQRTNSPCDIFTRFAHYFQLNLDETYLLCNEGDIKVIGRRDKHSHEKIAVTQFFQ